MGRAARLVVLLTVGALLRVGLQLVPGLEELLASRVEISSPISSLRRVREGLFLLDHGMSPYAGDVFHQPPLVVALFRLFPERTWLVIFTALDLLVAGLLYRMTATSSRLTTAANGSTSSIVGDWKGPQRLPEWVAGAYLFNPLTLASCVGQSTCVLPTAAVALALTAALQGLTMTSLWWLACATYLDIWPCCLLVPVAIIIRRANARLKPHATQSQSFCFAALAAWSLILAAFLGVLLYLSYSFMGGSCDFLEGSYGAMFWVWDLTPSLGLFWYLFTEMFERFRTFFLIIAHSHPAFYVVPLTLRFSDEPLFLAWVLIAINTVFKPYPVIGGLGFSYSMLLMHAPLVLPKSRRIYPLVWLGTLSGVMAILMWFLWIASGTGNANFYYFQSLIFVFCNAFAIVESIGAVRRLKAARNIATTAADGGGDDGEGDGVSTALAGNINSVGRDAGASNVTISSTSTSAGTGKAD